MMFHLQAEHQRLDGVASYFKFHLPTGKDNLEVNLANEQHSINTDMTNLMLLPTPLLVV